MRATEYVFFRCLHGITCAFLLSHMPCLLLRTRIAVFCLNFEKRLGFECPRISLLYFSSASLTGNSGFDSLKDGDQGLGVWEAERTRKESQETTEIMNSKSNINLKMLDIIWHHGQITCRYVFGPPSYFFFNLYVSLGKPSHNFQAEELL